MSNNVCFMGAKVAIPPEFLLSSMVKDTETTEKRNRTARLMGDTAFGNRYFSYYMEIDCKTCPLFSHGYNTQYFILRQLDRRLKTGGVQ